MPKPLTKNQQQAVDKIPWARGPYGNHWASDGYVAVQKEAVEARLVGLPPMDLDRAKANAYAFEGEQGSFWSILRQALSDRDLRPLRVTGDILSEPRGVFYLYEGVDKNPRKMDHVVDYLRLDRPSGKDPVYANRKYRKLLAAKDGVICKNHHPLGPILLFGPGDEGEEDVIAVVMPVRVDGTPEAGSHRLRVQTGTMLDFRTQREVKADKRKLEKEIREARRGAAGTKNIGKAIKAAEKRVIEDFKQHLLDTGRIAPWQGPGHSAKREPVDITKAGGVFDVPAVAIYGKNATRVDKIVRAIAEQIGAKIAPVYTASASEIRDRRDRVDGDVAAIVDVDLIKIPKPMQAEFALWHTLPAAKRPKVVVAWCATRAKARRLLEHNLGVPPENIRWKEVK